VDNRGSGAAVGHDVRMPNRDALSRMLDVVGVSASVEAEVLASPGTEWRLELPTVPWVWVASRFDQVWVGGTELGAGEVILVRSESPVAIATSATAVDPPVPPVSFDGIETGMTGVFWGVTRFGELADEVLGLPDTLHLASSSEVWTASMAALRMLGIEWRSDAPTFDAHGAVCDSLARMLVLLVLRDRSPLRFGDDAVKRALARIHADPVRPAALGISSLARVARVKERSFGRRFRAATGLAPGEYLQWWRSVVARSMLTRARVQDVASRCGYATPSAFAEAFRRSMGTSPSGFAERARASRLPAHPRFRNWHDLDRWRG
jgi:AraC-like DNA-binding protein